ncbi:dodecin family protein [Rhodopirellula bahusiensis]|uniref:dodecin family protein n=1 Tax=Rhodopirellula bahusiensis TaxID=2014065 RepID=UPI0032636098
MSLAKVIEVVASSESSFDDAVKQGISEAAETLRGISGAKVTDYTVDVADGKPTQFKVTMDVAFSVEKKQAVG